MTNVLRVLNENHKYRHIYDPAFESQKYLQKVNDFIWINYTRIKRVAVISGRDIIIIVNFTVNEEGVIYIVGFSDEREDLVPLQPDRVRGGLPIGGFKIEHIKNQPGKILLTYIVDMDPRGSVPSFLLSTALKDQATKLALIRGLVADLEKQSK